MVQLTRIVRFALSANGTPNRGPNGYAGNPSMMGIGAHYELVVACRGDVDPTVGYLINIKEIDKEVRAQAVPALHASMRQAEQPEAALRTAFRSLRLPGLSALRWKLSPYHSLEVTADAPSTVLLRQKFDFCAAHRLHAPTLSHEENQRLFGKCNNPGGHGHNYQFEPCVALQSGRDQATSFALSDLERIADDIIVQRFDHKNLNSDTAEFRDGSGLNPSVENIAQVCFKLLAPAINRPGVTLQAVTVWESDRTSCTFPG